MIPSLNAGKDNDKVVPQEQETHLILKVSEQALRAKIVPVLDAMEYELSRNQLDARQVAVNQMMNVVKEELEASLKSSDNRKLQIVFV